MKETEQEEINSLKGVELVYLNVRNLLKHIDELRATLLDGNFDVVIFGESWLNQKGANSLIHCDGYRIFRLDRAVLNHNGQPKFGGGICVFVRKNVDVVQLKNHKVSNPHAEILNLGIQKKVIRE